MLMYLLQETAPTIRRSIRYAPKTTQGKAAAATRDFKASLTDSAQSAKDVFEQSKLLQQQRAEDKLEYLARLKIEDQRY